MTIPYRYVNKHVVFRKFPIVTGNIYHIFNRGVNKSDIFYEPEDYENFLKAAVHYKTKSTKFSYTKLTLYKSDDTVSSIVLPLAKVEILAYCLMPNHFHLMIKQVADDGITNYMRRLGNSHSHYINVKYKRTGPLFESRYKNVLVETDQQLVHLSRYIHLNPLVSGMVSNTEDYKWSSLLGYVGETEDKFCDTKTVLGYFKSGQDYKDFVLDQAEYAGELDKIKHLTIDLE